MEALSRPDPRSTLHRRWLILSIALTFCLSCAAPRRAPIADSEIAASVAGRASSIAELETALALADLGPLAVPRPSKASLDPESAEFWYLCAYLWEPGARRARRTLEAKRALAKGAGRVQALLAGGDMVGAGRDRETEAMATLDLLALLGLGPSAAAKELANAEVCEAFADLEVAVWAARFRVERAMVRLTAAREREVIATRIEAEAALEEPRFQALEQGGRGTPAGIAWARAMLARVKGAQERARVETAKALEELGVSSGLPSDHPALVPGVAWRPLGGAETLPFCDVHCVYVASTDARELLASVPKLRSLKMKYAVSEARLRGAVSSSWPSLAVGPKLKVIPDSYLGGGVVDVTIPMPSPTRARICAATIERTAAREALEDALVEALARNRSLNEQKKALLDQLEGSVPLRRDAAERMWKAARARFLSDESALDGWAFALEARLEASLAAVDAKEAEQLAELAICEASPRNPTFELGQVAETRP